MEYHHDISKLLLNLVCLIHGNTLNCSFFLQMSKCMFFESPHKYNLFLVQILVPKLTFKLRQVPIWNFEATLILI